MRCCLRFCSGLEPDRPGGDSSDDVTGDDWRTSGVVAAEGTITHEGEGSVKVLVTVGPESAAFYRDEPEQELFEQRVPSP